MDMEKKTIADLIRENPEGFGDALTTLANEDPKLYSQIVRIDPQTRLFSKMYFENVLLPKAIKDVDEDKFSSICYGIFDIDDFSKLNESEGHRTGDNAIALISDIIRNNFRTQLKERFESRPFDLMGHAGRVGQGEEFAVILYNCDLNGGYTAMGRLKERIGKIGVTVSGGIAQYTKDCSLGKEEVIKKADSALYKAKSDGKNKVCKSE